jgi:hypothetical protein
MLSLKWGDVLSTLLPGALALFAISPYFPLLNNEIQNIDKISVSGGFALLIASALAGGLLEALTRITWERWWLQKRCPSSDALSSLTPTNLDLYERGVQSSYKYVTFYANFAWAVLTLLIVRLVRGVARCSVASVLLITVIAVLLWASHVQWTYFVNYQKKLFSKKE